MKPMNFPLRKLLRQAKAQGRVISATERQAARSKRTKKGGGPQARMYRRAA